MLTLCDMRPLLFPPEQCSPFLLLQNLQVFLMPEATEGASSPVAGMALAAAQVLQVTLQYSQTEEMKRQLLVLSQTKVSWQT